MNLRAVNRGPQGDDSLHRKLPCPTNHPPDSKFDVLVEGPRTPHLSTMEPISISQTFSDRLIPFYPIGHSTTKDRWVLEIIKIGYPFTFIPATYSPSPSIFRGPFSQTSTVTRGSPSHESRSSRTGTHKIQSEGVLLTLLSHAEKNRRMETHSRSPTSK